MKASAYWGTCSESALAYLRGRPLAGIRVSPPVCSQARSTHLIRSMTEQSAAGGRRRLAIGPVHVCMEVRPSSTRTWKYATYTYTC